MGKADKNSKVGVIKQRPGKAAPVSLKKHANFPSKPKETKPSNTTKAKPPKSPAPVSTLPAKKGSKAKEKYEEESDINDDDEELQLYNLDQLDDAQDDDESGSADDSEDDQYEQSVLRSKSKPIKQIKQNKKSHEEDDDDDDGEEDDEEDDEEEDEELDEMPAGKRSLEAMMADSDTDGDENQEEEEDLLPIERDAMELDEERMREEEDAEEEFQTNIHQRESMTLPSGQEVDLAERLLSAPDLATVKQRIQDVCLVLDHFKQARDQSKSRQDYLQQLAADLEMYYGYSAELVAIFMQLFPPAEVVEFLEANEAPRPVTIRTNTLKTNRKTLIQSLANRGVVLEPLADWTKEGIKITESQVPIGATPEYLAGHYMLQSASSFLPVLALRPQPNERILDMAAAPGGKTTFIAQMMKNTGTLFANDFKLERTKALVANLHRLGVRNCVVTNYDGRKYPSVMTGFSRILLDAPCSGLGVISRDPSIKLQKTYKDIQRQSQLQKELILAAIDCLEVAPESGEHEDGAEHNGAGVLVYSTCSISVEENEAIVDYALKHRAVKVLDTGLPLGEEGFTRYRDKRFHPSLRLTRRFYPHIHNMDGFFVAKLVKIGKSLPGKQVNGGTDSTEADQTESTAEETTAPKSKSPPSDKKQKSSASEPKPLTSVTSKKPSATTANGQSSKKSANGQSSTPGHSSKSPASKGPKAPSDGSSSKPAGPKSPGKGPSTQPAGPKSPGKGPSTKPAGPKSPGKGPSAKPAVSKATDNGPSPNKRKGSTQKSSQKQKHSKK